MSKYKLIIEYYQKGNNNSQIATLCSCSRMTVWRVFQRIKALGIEIYALKDMSEEEISSLLSKAQNIANNCFSIFNKRLIYNEHI